MSTIPLEKHCQVYITLCVCLCVFVCVYLCVFVYVTIFYQILFILKLATICFGFGANGHQVKKAIVEGWIKQ